MKKEKKDTKNILRDDAEPTVRKGAVYLPMWLMGLLALLLYWGCYHVDENGGGFSEMVFAPYRSTTELTKIKPGGEDTTAALGAATYAKICVACHQASGMGVAGQFPPLGGSDWVQAAGPNRVIRIILNGLTGPITVGSQQFNGTMLPWRDGLSDKEIAAVASYVRTSFGNKASKVTEDQVKKIREASKDKGDNYTVEEVLKFSESD